MKKELSWRVNPLQDLWGSRVIRSVCRIVAASVAARDCNNGNCRLARKNVIRLRINIGNNS